MKEREQKITKCPYCQTPLLGTDWFQFSCECGYHSPKQQSKEEAEKIVNLTCVIKEVESLDFETKKDVLVLIGEKGWEYYPGGVDCLEDGDSHYLELPDFRKQNKITEIEKEITVAELALAKAKEKLEMVLLTKERKI